MKNTALTHIHESLGAKMVPFAGYNMPVQYEGVNAETFEAGAGFDALLPLLYVRKCHSQKAPEENFLRRFT